MTTPGQSPSHHRHPSSQKHSGFALSAGCSTERHPEAAADEATAQCIAGLSDRQSALANPAAPHAGSRPAPRADVVFAFVSQHHARELATIERVITRQLAPRHVIAMAGEGVISGAVEIEAAPAVSLLACTLPGVRLTPFDHSAIAHVAPRNTLAAAEALVRAAALDAAHRCSIVLADPFSTRTGELLEALTLGARLANPGAPASHQRPSMGSATGPAPVVVGGLASGLTRPGEARLMLDGRVQAEGFVGLSMAGPIEAQAVVSQGCKPIGPTMVVTSANGPVIRTLGGRKALDALRELIEGLGESRKRELSRGLMLGLAVSEYRDRFGRGDFVIRDIPGVHEDEGSITVADIVRTGMTVQFHVRDAQTADDDLRMLMDAQALHQRPLGALLFTCSARGTRLFNHPHHDARCIQESFAGQTPGEHAAKAGTQLAPGGHARAFPLAGIFAAGEIGPVGADVRLHAQTACALFLRAPADEHPPASQGPALP